VQPAELDWKAKKKNEQEAKKTAQAFHGEYDKVEKLLYGNSNDTRTRTTAESRISKGAEESGGAGHTRMTQKEPIQTEQDTTSNGDREGAGDEEEDLDDFFTSLED
jgi:hypothetical protein